jgi:L-lactate permease
VPAYLVLVLAGWRRMRQVLPAVAVTGITFAIVQFVVSNFVGPELTDVVAALASMAALTVLLRFWRPRETWDFAPARGARPVGGGLGEAAPIAGPAPTEAVDPPGRVLRAYLMYVVLVVVILVGQMGNLPFFSGHPAGDVKTALHPPANLTADLKCGTPAFKLCPLPWYGPDPARDRQAFKFPVWSIYWPGSYEEKNGKPVSLIFREPPIVKKSAEYPLTFTWDFLAAAGSLVLYAALIAFLFMLARGVPFSTLFVTYGRTLRQLALPIVTIALILAISSIMNYSGMTATLALALSKAGVVFPFVSAFLGCLGVFLTGSDTSSNTLFGPLQAQTAQQLHNVSPILTAGTNSSGGVMGKMISPQNLSVGAAGVNRVGAEGEIFRRVIGYSLILTSLVGVVAMIEAYLVPGIIPTP